MITSLLLQGHGKLAVSTCWNNLAGIPIVTGDQQLVLRSDIDVAGGTKFFALSQFFKARMTTFVTIFVDLFFVSPVIPGNLKAGAIALRSKRPFERRAFREGVISQSIDVNRFHMSRKARVERHED